MSQRSSRACRACLASLLLAGLVAGARPADAQTTTVVDVVSSTNAMERSAAAVSAATDTVSRAGDAAIGAVFADRFTSAGTRGIALRLLKLALLDLPIVHFADGLNHEFGHMARARETGLPLRFRLVGGPWSSPQFDLWSAQPSRLGLATFAGGFEAELLRESRLLDRAAEEQTRGLADAITLVDGAIGRLYYVRHDLGALCGRSSDDLVYDAGDPRRYVYGLVEARLGRADAEHVMAAARSVRAHAWLNLADAGLWAQAWNVAKFVWTGSVPGDPYWLRVHGVGLMPFTQYHLSPIGPQTQIGTRFRAGGNVGEFSVRWIDPARGSREVGSGLWWSRTSGRLVHPHVRVDLWRGPDRHAGARVEAGAVTPGWPSTRASLQISAGAKSEGYVLGLPQKRGSYLETGLRLRF